MSILLEVGRALQISIWILQLLSKKEQREEKGGEEQGMVPVRGGQRGVECGLAEDGTVARVFADHCEPLGVRKEKILAVPWRLAPDTCMPWPDPNPAGGKCSLSTDLTGEIFPTPSPCFCRKERIAE